MTTEATPRPRWTPLLYDIAQALEAVDEPTRRIEHVMAILAHAVPYERCALLESGQVLAQSLTVRPGLPPPDHERLASRLGNLLVLLSERPRGAQPAVTRDATGQGSHLAVPVIGLGEVIGLLSVDHGGVTYDTSHLAFLSIVAAQLGAYLCSLRSERVVRQSEARFRRLYDAGMIGIGFLDDRGRILEANESLYATLGLAPGTPEARALRLQDLRAPSTPDAVAEHERELERTGVCAPYEQELRRADGTAVTALIGQARIDGDAFQRVIFVLDVSARRRAEVERATALASLERSVELLELFLGILGHDLRGPLGVIRMSAQQLRRASGEVPARSVERILTSADRMTRMVDQLLDYTRIRFSGGMPIDPQPANLAALCSRALDELKALHPATQVHFEALGDLAGSWDADRILQAVGNLLGNAVQHGLRGHPITVTLDGRGPVIELRVHNQGQIPDAVLPVVFEQFRHAAQRTRPSGGLGLGLFISRAIVEAHRGSIDVASSRADGTTVTVRLPRQCPRTAQDPP